MRPATAAAGRQRRNLRRCAGSIRDRARNAAARAGSGNRIEHGGQRLARLHGLRSREAVPIGRAGEERLRDQKLQMPNLRIGAAACAKTTCNAAAQAGATGVGGSTESIGLSGADYAAFIR